MKKILFLLIALMISCSNSTEPKDSPYAGERAIFSYWTISFDSDSIEYGKPFKVITSIGVQKYRMKGELRFLSSLLHHPMGKLLSPDIEIIHYYYEHDTNKIRYSAAILKIDLYPNQDFKQECEFIADTTGLNQTYYDKSFYCGVELLIDSILLDMDTLYGRPTGPVAVPEKRWYLCNPRSLDSLYDNDRTFLERLFFSSEAFWKNSQPKSIYFKK